MSFFGKISGGGARGGGGAADEGAGGGGGEAEGGGGAVGPDAAGAGQDNTTGLMFGGYDYGVPGPTGKTEQFNGTNWTEVNDLNTGRREVTGDGIVTAALIFGGKAGTTIQAITEDWNGVNWSEVADLSTARELLGGAGTSTTALAFGGSTGSDSAATEEWSQGTTIKTVDTD